MTPEANQKKALKLMAQTATIVTTFDRLRNGNAVVAGDPTLGFAANFLYTLTGKKPDDVMEQAFDVALTLHAEHELNASTFAARVTAATLSDIYSAVTSAIGALRGPLHGGANEDVIKLLLEAGYARARRWRWSRTCWQQDQKIPGFGHRVYHTVDPRAACLKGMAEELGKRTGHEKLYQISKADREVHQRGQESERQRGFLLGLHLLLAGDSGGPVHADLRGEPHVGLDGAHSGAVRQQPADPSARGVHRARRSGRSGSRSPECAAGRAG